MEDDLGKSILVSFPAHELHLIDELDRLAHLEMTTKSQFLRRCIRRESKKVDEQVGRRYTGYEIHPNINCPYGDAEGISKTTKSKTRSINRNADPGDIQQQEVKGEL